MPYELQSLLRKCDNDDLSFLISRLASRVNLSATAELEAALKLHNSAGRKDTQAKLLRLVEREIRYAGSADFAYARRKLSGRHEPAGVSIDEIIGDVSRKLGVKQKLLGSVEAKLERLVRSTVEKTFFNLSPEQQRELFEKVGVDKKVQGEFFERLKKNKAHFMPLLLTLLGPKIAQKLVEGIVAAVIARFIGSQAAKEVIKILGARFPWWAEWLGPIVWALSAAWLTFDLQGAAYRITIPVLLYLGLVGLRDGPEDGDEFWAES